jgi:D-xylose transport system substrate-binding protein
MKLLSNILKVLLLVFIIAGCNRKPKIGFLMDSLEIDRWKKDKELFEQRINELGGIPLIRVADGKSPKQLSQAKELIYEGVDVLVVIPVDLHSSRDIVKEAHEKNIPVISYDRMIRDCDVDFYISTDNINIGELQAEYLSKIKPYGNYVLIGGPTKDYNATLMHLGWMNALTPLIERGDVNVVVDQYAKDWNREEAYSILNNYLTESDSAVDAVIAGNDELASGIIQALKEHNMQQDVLVAGQDAELEAIRNIVAGYQTITIYKPIDAMAYSAANMAMKLAANEEPVQTPVTVNNGHKLVPSVLLPAQVVNKNNIKTTVVTEGFMTEDEIFK